MNKNKIKKYMIILFIILIILLILIVFSKIYFTSRSYIILLLSKGDKNINYRISYDNDEMIDYVRGNEEKLVFSDGKTYYANYETGESIFINPEDKTIELDKVEKNDNPHSSMYIKDINSMNYEYVKTTNSNEYIVIKLCDNKNNNEMYLTKKIFINKKLGIIEKIEKYVATIYGEENLISKKVYKMHTGEVSELDIEKPDLMKYAEYQVIK